METFKYAFFLKLKFSLNSLLISKTLRIQIFETEKNKSENSPNLINLLMQDVQKLENGVRSLVDTFGIICELLFGVSYLYYQLQSFNFENLSILVVLLMLGNISIVGISQIFSLRGQKARDLRVGLLQEVFQGIKAIKTLCWENIFEKKVAMSRRKEFTNIKIIRIIDSLFNFFIRSISLIIMYVLIVWMEKGKTLENIINIDLYSALLLVNRLVYPITAFPWSVGSAIGVIFPYIRLSQHIKTKEISLNSCHPLQEFSISIENLTFSWDNTNDSIKINSLQINKGDFVMVYGGNGSGKTTFLRLLLGEITPQTGSIKLNKESVAYVSQDTWLINGSFKENIVLDQEYDENRYNSCLKACELYEEVHEKNQDFLIGANGSKLSGGQRQRTSLCRALYQNKDIFLLDDIFSALDEKVAEEIFKHYIIDNLVKNKKTIIFITSQKKFFDHCQKIYKLKNGELKISKNIYKEKKTDLLNKVPKVEKIQSKEENFFTEAENPKKISEKLEKIKLLHPFSSSGIKRYLSAIGYSVFFLIICVSLSQQAIRHYCEVIFNQSLSDSSKNSPENTSKLALIFILFTLARGFVYCYGILKASQSMFTEVFKVLMRANMEFYEENEYGDLINHLTRDIDSIDCSLPEDVNGWVSNLINVIGIFFVMCYEFPILIGVCWIIAQKAFKHYHNFRKNNKVLNQNIKMKESRLLTELMEVTQGIIMIRAFKKEAFFLKRTINTLKNYIFEGNFSHISHRKFLVSVSNISLLTSSCTLLFSLLYFLYENQPYDSKALGIALSYSLLVSRHLIDSICSTVSLENELLSLQRLSGLEEESKKPLTYPANISKNQEIQKGLIVFSSVNLKYGQNENYSLKNIIFSIEKGDKVAFCGRTGSGKSSILSVLLKMYAYSDGSVYYDGKEIRDWDTEEMRKSIGMIPQNGFLFKGTLKENLDPINSYKEKDIENIIKYS